MYYAFSKKGTLFKEIWYSVALIELSCCKNRAKKVTTKKMVWGLGDV
jgi:hypothetical protein